MKMKGRVRGRSRDLILTPKQRDDLVNAKHVGGGHEQLFGRLAHEAKTRTDGTILMKVYADDMERLEKLAARQDKGTWQRWAAEVLAANSQSTAN
jgi:hypothetical protein